MTAAVEPGTTVSPSGVVGRDGRRAAWLLAGLVVSVAARSLTTTAGVADGVTIGLGFGAMLLAVAVLGGWAPERRPGRRSLPSAIGLGFAGGAALVGLALVARALGGSPIGPSMGSLVGGGVFGGWAVATLVVAAGEEALLRGALLDRLAAIAGPWSAIAVTSVAFALMHVPFYGWHVVPLDIGVGIWLAGLRLETGGIVAPWLAHTVADLATWWL